MSTYEEFIQAIAASPYDDAVRLQCADWLEEQGDEQQARFIRTQVALEPIRYRFENPDARRLHQQENELVASQHESRLIGLPDKWDGPEKCSTIKFRRGFPSILYISAQNFLDDGEQILGALPTIYRVEIYRLEMYGSQLAASTALQSVTELSLSCWYSDEDAADFAATPNLEQLRTLCIWMGREGRLRDRRLIETMAGSKAWPVLCELTLLDTSGREKAHSQKYTKLGNRVAGVEIVKFRQGYPETYVIDPSCNFLFPGKLPGGESALSIVDMSNSKVLLTITFDEKGVQTEQVIRTPLPAKLRRLRYWSLPGHHELIREHLREKIGLKSDYIRVHDYLFPEDINDSFSPAPQTGGPYGLRDGDARGWPLENHPAGIGGAISESMNLGEYCVLESYCADRTGQLVPSEADERYQVRYY